MKVRLFISPGESFPPLTREAERSETSRLSLQRAGLTSAALNAGDETFFPGFTWTSHHWVVHSGGDGGARLQVSSAESQRCCSGMWECSSVRGKWSEVNRKRLIYTAVITLVFSYPRREEGCQREDGGGGEESDAWGLRDGRFQLAGGQTARTGGWREEIKES